MELPFSLRLPAIRYLPWLGWPNHRWAHEELVVSFVDWSHTFDYLPSHVETTTNAVVLIGYSVGNAAGPAMWKSQYQPL